MELHSLKYAPKSRGHKVKTYGRGHGSGIGGTSTRGNNGQHQRKSGNTRLGFEGGQTPIYRRLPKIGFKNINAKNYATITLKEISLIPESTINLGILKEYRFLQKKVSAFKIIGDFKIDKPLDVSCNYISANAKKIIEDAGGKVHIISK